MQLNEFLGGLSGKTLEEANRIAEAACGIVDFFEEESYCVNTDANQASKIEYGDWQTNLELARNVCLLVKSKCIVPSVIVEPTCGTGTFILASIAIFGDSVTEIYGIEIFKPYLNKLKFRLLDYALKNPGVIRCKIHLIHQNIFEFDFGSLRICKEKNLLIIGNPPWVTNSKLGEINSKNTPRKSNYKNVKGLDAITGKANFDIAEYITCKLLDYFHDRKAYLAFLMKNSVAKSIVYGQVSGRYCMESITQYDFDTKKEFDVSVAACLFVAKLGCGQAKQCTVKDLYSHEDKLKYGWVGDCFVSNVQFYSQNSHVDGRCQLIWRSGMKHDCSKVMELEKRGGKYFNALSEEVDIEPDLLYPFLKSSDIKEEKVTTFRKYVIVTQRSTSDDTSIIKEKYPRTYKYLEKHAEWFDKRGSVIYKNRPKFCIFGIGSYSFKKYKIAIAGLYKSTTFSLVGPLENKCTMLDDTCYLLGFENEEVALCFMKILNSPLVQRLMLSLVFFDAKRSINKDLLMRIDIEKAASCLCKENYLTREEYLVVGAYFKSLKRSNAQQLKFDFCI